MFQNHLILWLTTQKPLYFFHSFSVLVSRTAALSTLSCLIMCVIVVSASTCLNDFVLRVYSRVSFIRLKQQQTSLGNTTVRQLSFKTFQTFHWIELISMFFRSTFSVESSSWLYQGDLRARLFLKGCRIEEFFYFDFVNRSYMTN